VVSTETHTEDEQAVQQEKSDTQSSEHSVPVDTVRDETLTNRQELSDSVTDSTISTSLDSSTITAELENEQKQQQETTSVESLPSEIQVRLYFRT